jgi:hypothetical protein
MTQAAKGSFTATPRAGGSQPTPNGHGSLGEQDLVGDRDVRNERIERDSRDEQRTSGSAPSAASSGTETAANSVTVASPGVSRAACSAPWSR